MKNSTPTLSQKTWLHACFTFVARLSKWSTSRRCLAGRSRMCVVVVNLALLTASPSSQAQSAVVRNQWLGLANFANAALFGGSIFEPPDTQGAAGPNGIVAVVNLLIGYYAKTGMLIWGPIDLTTFWSSVGNTGTGNSDPKAIFDPASGRFFVIMQENTTPGDRFFLNLAVSKSSHPATSGNADWFFYRVDMTDTGLGTTAGGDYPGLGVDGQAVYVTYNMYVLPIGGFNITFGAPQGTKIIILNKAAIISGTLTFNTIHCGGFTLQPATVIGAGSPGNIAFFGEVPFAFVGHGAVKIWAVTDPLGTPSIRSTDVSVPDFGGAAPDPGAPQAGTTLTIDTLDSRTQGNAFWHDGAIWFCNTGGGTSGRAIVFWYKVTINGFPSGGTPPSAESGFIDGGPGVWSYQPSIGGNNRGDACIVFTRSSATTFPTILSTTRPVGASGFEAPVTLRVSPTFYNGSRWGDYATVTADPVDGSFWVAHQWAQTASFMDWGTWWANIDLPGNIIFVDRSFTGPFPNGTVTAPFPMVSQANQVAYGGETIRIAGGYYDEHPLTLNKRLRLENSTGPGRPVTIGRSAP